MKLAGSNVSAHNDGQLLLLLLLLLTRDLATRITSGATTWVGLDAEASFSCLVDQPIARRQ
jgi:hypothetical protein